MKDIVYGRQDGEEGPGVVCSTLFRKVDGSSVYASQCSAFYGADISNFKKLLWANDESLRAREK